jgi:hypothetical protein
MRYLNGELLLVENIQYLVINVLGAPSFLQARSSDLAGYQGDRGYEHCVSLFPRLEVFKDLKEVKLVLNLRRYAEPVQKPRELLVGIADLLAGAGIGEGKLDPDWQLNDRNHHGLKVNYTQALHNCGDLKEVLKSDGYGFKFL